MQVGTNSESLSTYATDTEERQSVLKAIHDLRKEGVLGVTAGNISRRGPKGSILITPSGMMWHEVEFHDIVKVGQDGKQMPEPAWAFVPARPRRMSVETPLHMDLYRAFPRVNAIAHTHSPNATAISMTGVAEVPLCHIYVPKFGGDTIRVARPFAPVGSKELSASAIRALNERSGCFVANHGAVVMGRTMEEAVLLALGLEELAKVFILASAAARAFGCAINLIPPEGLPELLAAMNGYQDNQFFSG